MEAKIGKVSNVVVWEYLNYPEIRRVDCTIHLGDGSIDKDEVTKELNSILKNNRREFFRQTVKEAARITDEELAEKEKELIKKTTPSIKLSPRYWYYKNKYPAMTDSEIQELMKGRKQIAKMKQNYENVKKKVKWQRRFNTGKNCLKWGLLIFIAFKV